MNSKGIYPTPGLSVKHEGENYENVPIPLIGLEGITISCPKDVVDLSGHVIGHDSRSGHEDPHGAKEEVEANLARLRKEGLLS